jgi:hypothetical protein
MISLLRIFCRCFSFQLNHASHQVNMLYSFSSTLLGARRVVSEGSITTSLLIDRTLKLSLHKEVFKDTPVFPAYSQVFPLIFLPKGRNYLTT